MEATASSHGIEDRLNRGEVGRWTGVRQSAVVQCGLWATVSNGNMWGPALRACAPSRPSRSGRNDSMPSLIPSCRAQCQALEEALTGQRVTGLPTGPGAALGKWRETHVTHCSAGLAGTLVGFLKQQIIYSYPGQYSVQYSNKHNPAFSPPIHARRLHQRSPRSIHRCPVRLIGPFALHSSPFCRLLLGDVVPRLAPGRNPHAGPGSLAWQF